MKTTILEKQVTTPLFEDADSHEDTFVEKLLIASPETSLEDLLLEHFTGRHEGLLRAAIDFVQAYYQMQGECPDTEILEEGLAEGFSEAEIAAAIHLLQSRNDGDQPQDTAPLWTDHAVSL